MKRILLLLSVLVPLMFLSCGQEDIPKSEETENIEDENDKDKNDQEDETPGEGESDDGNQDDGNQDDGNQDDGNQDNGDQGGQPTPPITGTVEIDRLYGYAEGTTGGEGGKVHHFNDGAKFRDWLKLREKNKSKDPAVVWLSGTFTKEDGRDSGSPWFDIKRTSNISIYGTDDFRMKNVGFFLNEASNIIIRNVYMIQPKADNGADALSIQESSDIWIDHCTFESVNQTKDYEDGSCDVTHQSTDVTISWCHFIKTQKSCLIGHSNNASSDEVIKVTMHHNWFDLSSSRHPRVRFGRAHVYNNYFNQCSTYGVGSAYGAKVLVECNLFAGVRLPVDICTFPAKKSGDSWVSNLTGSVAGYVYERENVFLDKPSNASYPYPFTNLEYIKYGGEKLAQPLTFDDFMPTYEYVADKAEDLADIVSASAGVARLAGYDKAPVEVDNGGLGTSDEPGSGDDSSDEDPVVPPAEDMGDGWYATACGDKSYSAEVSGKSLCLTANGKFESGAQSFGYVYREVSGDFEATVRIVSFDLAKDSNQGLAGILMTPDHTKQSTDFLYAMSARSQSSYYYSFRLSSGAKTSKGTLPDAEGQDSVVLRLRRVGDELYASYSLDGGMSYGNEKKNTIEGLSDKVFIGLAANSASNSDSGVAVFEDFTLNGESVPF